MHESNGREARMLTDPVQSGGGLVLGGRVCFVFPRRRAWRAPLAARGVGCLCHGPLQKQTLDVIFAFHLFFVFCFLVKVEILSRFFSVRENKH